VAGLHSPWLAALLALLGLLVLARLLERIRNHFGL